MALIACKACGVRIVISRQLIPPATRAFARGMVCSISSITITGIILFVRLNQFKNAMITQPLKNVLCDSRFRLFIPINANGPLIGRRYMGAKNAK